MNQIAQNLASYGRNGDSTLVHMSPQEVSGLQALARNHGTTMTINPYTGLPEAFNFRQLLPLIAGFALGPAGLGLAAWQAGLAVGAAGTAATGSLKEGVMMGLQASSGANLGGSIKNLAPASSTGVTSTNIGVTGGNPFMPGTPGQITNGYAATVPPGPSTAANPFVFKPPPVQPSNAIISPAAPPTAPTSVYTPEVDLGQGRLASASPNWSPRTFDQIPSRAPPSATPSSASPSATSSSASPLSEYSHLNTPNTSDAASTWSGRNVTPFDSVVGNSATNVAANPVVTAPDTTTNLATGRGLNAATTDATSIADRGNETLGDRFSNNMNKTWAGAKEISTSPEAAGKFLGDNKMNMAMAVAPLLLEKPEPLPEEETYMRPYTLDVENLSDRPASTTGEEEERLRYKYTAGTPYRYRAAQGGLIAFAQGGNTRSKDEYQSDPAMMQRIAETQLPFFAGIMDPRRTKDIYGMTGQGYAEGGETDRREVRKKINRMDDPYIFAAYQTGRGLYEAAMQNFAGGGLANMPRFLSGVGDGMSDSIPASINDRQPARLADGEFVVPADVVSHLGNGSSKAGAKQLYAMMDRVRAKRTGKKKQAPAVNPKKMMPA